MMSQTATRERVEAISKAIEDHYVFPDRAAEIAASIRKKMVAGRYDRAHDLAALCASLTQDLRDLSGDLHLRLEVAPEGAEDVERRRMQAGGYGIESVQRLSGNVGLLTLRYFAPAELAGDLMLAALRLLSGRTAVVFDLRRAIGGDPGMIALVSTSLFDREDGPKHLNDVYQRDGSIHQWWTLPWLPEPRIGSEVPVCVLTSRQTFSGAEEFCWNLQALERATIVGERTAGGAHPSRAFRMVEGVRVHIPHARSVNPHTGDNWEGQGVQPDLMVPADQALPNAMDHVRRNAKL